MNATLKITHPLFLRLLVRDASLGEMLLSDELEIEGSTVDLVRFFSLLDRPDGAFPIVTP